MTLEETLVELERRFWTEGSDFYREWLRQDALMVFPNPVGVLDREETIHSVSGHARWTMVRLEAPRVLALDQHAAILTYLGAAARDGTGETYVARASSVYVSEAGKWRLAFHQQTPIASKEDAGARDD